MDSQKQSRFLDGLLALEEPQSPEGTENDPQRIVMRQYLQTLASRNQTTSIIDIGSGLGVLAAEIGIVWPNYDAPTYVAVDLPGYLDKLAIPPNLHNNSRKFYFDDFFETQIAKYASASVCYVARNIIHELRILETAKLVFRLASSLSPGCEVYVQDMTNLPSAERGHVGWEKDDLHEVFEFSGFRVSPMKVTGRSGVVWFSFIATRQATTVNHDAILEKCIEKRKAQKIKLRSEFDNESRKPPPDSAELISRRGMEVTILDLQIEEAQTVLNKMEPIKGGMLPIRNTRIPLRSSAAEQYGSTGPSFKGLAELIGIEGALISKDEIDFAKLVSQAERRYWSVGYSQKSMFATDQNRLAFSEAVRCGVDVRVILADPSSALVRSVGRARASGGSPSDVLSEQIDRTIQFCADFKNSLVGSEGGKLFSYQTVEEPLAGSYFFFDDLCFFSIYGRSITGSRAPCLIFGKRTARLAGIYEILEEDFLSLWKERDSSHGNANEN